MYMVVIFSFPLFLVVVLIVFLWTSFCLVVARRFGVSPSSGESEEGETPKRRENKTKR